MLILCVQIGCIYHWRCHPSITVVIRAAATFQGPFKAYHRAFATTVVSGPQGSKESEKEIIC